MRLRLGFSLLLALAATTQSFAQKTTVPPEFLVFEIPRLPMYGDVYHSWYVLRGPLLWTPTGSFDLRKLAWPKWETNQVPPAMTYVGPNDVRMVILDENGGEIERVELRKGFSPQLYNAPDGRTASSYRIELVTKPARVFVATKSYPWPRPKQLFNCDIEVITKDPDKASIESSSDSLLGSGPEEDSKTPPLESHPKVKLCLESLQGVAKTAAAGKQWYVDITWPRPLTRRSQMFISEIERTFKSSLSRNKHVLVARRTQGRRFIASAGLTEIEKLQKPSADFESLPKNDWQGPTPSRDEAAKGAGEFTTTDGGRLVITAFANDIVGKRSLDSPAEFVPPINVQFVKAPEPEAAVRQTEFREERTGIAGFLRPWFVAASLNYHTVKSSRGENMSSLNAPAIEIAWRSPYFDLEPFFTLEPGYWNYNSPLTIQESHAGLRYRLLKNISPFVGYFSYGLRGTNPSGATRLGSIDGFSLGVHGFYRIEDYILRGWMTAIGTSPFSYDSYAEIGKILSRGSGDRGFFVGFFAGYTQYREDLQNRTRQTETFSETRFKFGVSAGLAGPDYVSLIAPKPAVTMPEDKNFAVRFNALTLASGIYKFLGQYEFGTRWLLGPELGYTDVTSGDIAYKGYHYGARGDFYPRGPFTSGWYGSTAGSYTSLDVSTTSGLLAAAGTLSTPMIEAGAGYHWLFRHINVALGGGYRHAMSDSVTVRYNTGSQQNVSPAHLRGWKFELLTGLSF